KERIFVEHSIGGMKRYRILADRLRNRTMTLYNLALETVAGLWNFYLKN
ncbi:MAG: transposase family protein, partial [Aureispira sp.]|nr:transposase family protein [Aureispira sp.]